MSGTGQKVYCGGGGWWVVGGGGGGGVESNVSVHLWSKTRTLTST